MNRSLNRPNRLHDAQNYIMVSRWAMTNKNIMAFKHDKIAIKFVNTTDDTSSQIHASHCANFNSLVRIRKRTSNNVEQQAINVVIGMLLTALSCSNILHRPT